MSYPAQLPLHFSLLLVGFHYLSVLVPTHCAAQSCTASSPHMLPVLALVSPSHLVLSHPVQTHVSPWQRCLLA